MLLAPPVAPLDLPPVALFVLPVAAVPPEFVSTPLVCPPAVAVVPPVTMGLLLVPLQPGTTAPNNTAAAAVGQILMLGAEFDAAR